LARAQILGRLSAASLKGNPWRRLPLAEGSSRLVENCLLALLPKEDYQRLCPNLEPVALEFRQTLYQPHEPITHIFFPLLGVVSWVTVMRDGSSVEVATVGNEGVIGIPTLLGAETMRCKVMVQVPGQAMRMPVGALGSEMARGGQFLEVLHRYLNAFLTQVTQSVACNILHPLQQRCCRWLLMTHDRVKSDQFPLTHEFLAQMLGVRRASVTEVARKLQKAGYIDYIHGKITVRNRKGLEGASCECYRAVKSEFDRLLEMPPKLA
jgi:CRP-like cAMP-binding protein